MQEEVDSRTVALTISAAKFTGRLFKAAVGKYMAHRKEKKLQKAMAELIQQRAQQNGDKTAFEERYQAITAQIEALEMKQIKEASRGENSRKMEDIEDFMDKTNCVLTEYDDKLVRQLIQNINVVNARKIEVVFKSGIVAEACLE